MYVFTLSRFEEFPDLWVSGAFTDMKKVSDANPQQAGYNWGTSELIDYINADGKTLQAILTKPENFDPSKKYPMLVYIYEELTNSLHRYVPPAPAARSINVTRYVSNGYIVLQPDIVYDIRLSGGERAQVRASPRCRTWSRWASSIRSGSASRATRGAATRSRT